MSCSKILQSFKSELLENFIKYFTNETNNSLFIGIGRILPWNRNALLEIKSLDEESIIGDDNLIPLSLDTDREKATLRRNMFYMKEVTPNDFSFLIKNYEWQFGTIYDNYRDDDQLFDEPQRNFFVYNKTEKKIFKCLDNNNRSSSNNQPSSPNSSSEPFRTADGYTWKLMYKLSDDEEIKFGIKGFGDLIDFLPVKFIDYTPTVQEEIDQKQFQDSAINGSIEFVDINPEFKQFIGLDREVCTFNNRCYLYADSATGSTTIDIHQCTLSVQETDGALKNLIFSAQDSTTGLEIQRRLITDSQQIIVETAPKSGGETGICIVYMKLHLNTPTDRFLPENNTRYSIEPWIRILGDGESDGLTAKSTIGFNSAEFKTVFNHGDDGISRLRNIEVIDKGKNYLYAKTFFPSKSTEESSPILDNADPDFVGIKYLGPRDAVDATGDSSVERRWLNNSTNLLIPILPPLGGHGSNPLKELGSSDLLFKTLFEGSEENKLTPDNDFRQIFLIKNPILNNPIVHLRFDTILPSEMDIGTQIFDGSNSGVVKKIYNYSTDSPDGITGFEILVDSISGSFKDSSSITASGNASPFAISSSIFSDSYKEYNVAGTENKNLMVVRMTNQSGQPFNGRPRDVVVGCGSTGSNPSSPSLASGMIRKLNISGNIIDIFLEDFSGKFKENEKLMVIPKNPAISPSIQPGIVLGSRYQKEDVRNIGYSLIAKIEISTSSDDFNESSFSKDDLIYSYSECPSFNRNAQREEIIGNGHVYSYKRIDDQTAIVEVVGAKYQAFQVGQFIPYGEDDNCAIINNVIESEIKYDSGEILHINNLSPISRSSSSREEVNFVISL